MASAFKPKEVLREAQNAEKAGNNKVASNLYATIAQYLRRREKFSEALVTIDRAIRLSSDSARLHLQKARICSSMEQRGEAEKAMKDFASLTLQKKRTHEYAAAMESQLEELPSLRAIFYEAVLEIERTSSFAFLGLARAQKTLGEFAKARSTLFSALKMRDKEEEVLGELKSVLEMQKDPDAIPFVEKYESGELKLEDLISLLDGPKKSPHRSKKEHTLTSHPFTEERNLRTLIEDLEKELGIKVDEDHDKVEPLVKEFRKRSEPIIGKDSRAKLDMGVAFYEMGLYKDAIDTVRGLEVTDPLYVDAQGLIANIYNAEGSQLSALDVYQNILRIETLTMEQKKEYLYQTAEIYRKLGDYDLALEVLGRLEKLVPEYRESHRMKIELKESKRKSLG